MDGFRDRLSGRYDRGMTRGDRYDRPDRMMDDRYDRPMDDRYDRPERSMDDRYDRGMRRPQPEAVVDVDAIAGAIEDSNREQLAVIADYFDDAKADRLESERAIIAAISDKIAESINEGLTQAGPAIQEAPVEEPAMAPVVDTEALARIERMVGQNAEALSESGELLEREYNSLRGSVELLNDIKGSIGDIQASQEELRNQTQYLSQNISQSVAASIQASGAGLESDVTNEAVLSAIGDNRALLNMIRQDIIAGTSAPSMMMEEPEAPKADSLTAEAADQYFKNLEELVHKECVKTYKNVGAKLDEANAEMIKEIKKTVSSGSVLSIVSVALNVITIAILVCMVLGILTF